MITLTNLNAMRSAAAMADSTADIKTSMERLSTGSRINSASDDAAGLAISARMDSQILGLAKAIANGSDAIGLLSTADGALDEASSLLQRMRELSLQSATGSVTAADRKYLNAEYQRLKNEIDRIGSQTQWNAMNIFDGVAFPGTTEFQVGANADLTIGAEIQDLATRTLAESPTAQLGTTFYGGSHSDIGQSMSISDDGSQIAIAFETSGTTRIFKYSTSGWIQLGGDLDLYSTGRVSMSGDGSTVAIVDPQGSDAFIYKYDSSSGKWIQLGSKIAAFDWGNRGGESLSISDDGLTVAIGRVGQTGDRGSTRVYRYDASSQTWLQLGASLNGENFGDKSGWSVSLSSDGNTLAIGAIYNDGNGDRSGHTRVYRYDTSASSWVKLGTDIDGDGPAKLAGYSVSLTDDGSTVAIGAIWADDGGGNSGQTRVYSFNTSSFRWEQVGNDIDGEALNDNSGNSVSISGDGNTLVIGAYKNNDGQWDAGHARIYEYDASSATWIQLGADIDGEIQYGYSGYSVSISADGSTVAVGAMGTGFKIPPSSKRCSPSRIGVKNSGKDIDARMASNTRPRLSQTSFSSSMFAATAVKVIGRSSMR